MMYCIYNSRISELHKGQTLLYCLDLFLMVLVMMALLFLLFVDLF